MASPFCFSPRLLGLMPIVSMTFFRSVPMLLVQEAFIQSHILLDLLLVLLSEANSQFIYHCRVVFSDAQDPLHHSDAASNSALAGGGGIGSVFGFLFPAPLEERHAVALTLFHILYGNGAGLGRPVALRFPTVDESGDHMGEGNGHIRGEGLHDHLTVDSWVGSRGYPGTSESVFGKEGRKDWKPRKWLGVLFTRVDRF